MSKIEHIIFDFDGTCTQIPLIYEAFLEEYRHNFSEAIATVSKEVTREEWSEAQLIVRQNSPREGWSVGGTPSAPVGADPYILSDEAAKLISRRRNIRLPAGRAYIAAHITKCRLPGDRRPAKFYVKSIISVSTFTSSPIPARSTLPADLTNCSGGPRCSRRHLDRE